MKILGAVLAGGRSSRFGSNKALAPLAQTPLVGHVLRALGPQVDALLLCGMTYADVPSVADRPAPDLGPMGGICAALAHGAAQGFDAVVTVGCDMPHLPADLVARLTAAGPLAIAQEYPIIGLWPTRLSADLDRFLADAQDRSVRRWALGMGACQVSVGELANVNSPADLARLAGDISAA